MSYPNIQPWCEDEVHFQRRTSLIRTWTLKGQQPRVLSASTRGKVGFFGALSLKTGTLFTQETATFNGETFVDFLSYLLQRTSGQIYLILDNTKYHRARILKEFFVQNQERLVLIFLPSYSPELNPIERVWRITRRQVTHNRYFSSKDELRTAMNHQFARGEQPNTPLQILSATI